MTKRKVDPRVAKWQGELAETLSAIDKQIGRVVRNVNKLNVLRTRRKRLERSIATTLSANMV